MKTFILIEKVMNGTVTMDVITILFQTKSFEKVVSHIKNRLEKLEEVENVSVIYENDNDKIFSYNICDQTFPIAGHIENKESKIINV